jgi:hypothetical protein
MQIQNSGAHTILFILHAVLGVQWGPAGKQSHSRGSGESGSASEHSRRGKNKVNFYLTKILLCNTRTQLTSLLHLPPGHFVIRGHLIFRFTWAACCSLVWDRHQLHRSKPEALNKEQLAQLGNIYPLKVLSSEMDLAESRFIHSESNIAESSNPDSCNFHAMRI